MTFKTKFCEHFDIPETEYEARVLALTLTPQARALGPWLKLLRHDTSPDVDFVRGVARITALKQLASEVADFQHHPRNRGLLRTSFRLRVSVRQMVALVGQVMGVTIEGTVDSRSPFGDFQG